MAIAKQTDKILIIGAGCFGTSTALHLLQRGFSNVTVIDRSPVLPAQDAASTDLNKIVRTSYDDLFYAQLAQKAIQDWKKNTSLWGDTYHESGVLVISAQSTDYGSAAYKNDIALGARLVDLPDGQAIRSVIPDTVPAASFQHTQGYLNKDGGWAFAAQGVERLLERVKSLGATIVPGKAATELVRLDDRVVGVRCADGDILEGDFIVIASGSWTACSFPEFDLGTRCFASGQCLVTIQLSPEEAARYADTPVILDWSSGFYTFPPNKDNIVKVAVHSTGYSRYVSGPSNPVSTPQTVTSHGQEGLRIPQEVTKFLRERLGKVYPELASKPFSSTRVCWYTDSPDGDWAIGPLPAAPNVFLATSGSGHAYKFLPNIGGLVADRLEGRMDSTLAAKFAVDRVFNKTDLSRRGEALRDLSTATLCNPEDLLP